MTFYKKFSFRLILRLVIILATMIALTLIFGDDRLFFNQIILLIFITIEVSELIRFLNHTNRELSKFLMAVKHSDFTVNFQKTYKGASFDELNEGFDEIIKTYKKTQLENEGHFQYLKMVVSNMNVGVISLENNENIVLMNKPADSLLDVEGIKNWKILSEMRPDFTKEIDEIADSGRKLIELKATNKARTLSVDVNSMILLNKSYKLITFQDIRGEIEQKEIEAWHKLIRILTHEIMNSATPIISLTETMQTLLEENGEQIPINNLQEETIKDIRFSLKTIHKRSEGMLAFIDDYRKLTKVPQPQLESVDVNEFLNLIKKLMESQLKKKDIGLVINPTKMKINCDPRLVEQILINLITNSIHALSGIESQSIEISAYEDGEHAIISIKDNGCGIPEKERNEIFVPFFSTKKEGSGIGLSLSKQIMYLHHGSIKVHSEVGSGTEFQLIFKS